MILPPLPALSDISSHVTNQHSLVDIKPVQGRHAWAASSPTTGFCSSVQLVFLRFLAWTFPISHCYTGSQGTFRLRLPGRLFISYSIKASKTLIPCTSPFCPIRLCPSRPVIQRTRVWLELDGLRNGGEGMMPASLNTKPWL